MTKAPNFPSLEEEMRRFLLTDPRYLDAFKAMTEGIEEKTATILAAIGELPDKVSQKMREEVPAITEQVSDQVALKIVGESYYKWNSTSSFYPTVVFIFREMNAPNRPKKSQIKTRLNVRTEDLNDQMIQQLHSFVHDT